MDETRKKMMGWIEDIADDDDLLSLANMFYGKKFETIEDANEEFKAEFGDLEDLADESESSLANRDLEEEMKALPRKLNESQELVAMHIENFIDFFCHDEDGRGLMKEQLDLFCQEDHVFEDISGDPTHLYHVDNSIIPEESMVYLVQHTVNNPVDRYQLTFLYSNFDDAVEDYNIDKFEGERKAMYRLQKV